MTFWHFKVKVEEELKEEDEKKVPKEENDESKEKEQSDDKTDEKESSAEATPDMKVSLSDTVIEEMDRLVEENKRLHNLITEMHQKHHEITLKVKAIFYTFMVQCSKYESNKLVQNY